MRRFTPATDVSCPLEIGRPMASIRGDLTIPGAMVVLRSLVEPANTRTGCRPRTLYEVRHAIECRTHQSCEPWGVYAAMTVIQAAAVQMDLLDDEWGDTRLLIMPGMLALLAGTWHDPVAHGSHARETMVDAEHRERLRRAVTTLAENAAGDLLRPYHSFVDSRIERGKYGYERGNDPLFWAGSRLVSA